MILEFDKRIFSLTILKLFFQAKKSGYMLRSFIQMADIVIQNVL